MPSATRKSLTRWVFLAMFPVLAATGCGAAKVNVSGKVNYKGAPLKGGTVTFASTTGKGDVTAQIGEDGSYTMEKVPVGQVKILVATESLKPKFNMGGPMSKGGLNAPPTYAAPQGQGNAANYNPQQREDQSKRYVAIPLEYGDPQKTKLTYDVKSGESTHNIDLD